MIGADAATRQRLAEALGAAGYVVRQAATAGGVRTLAAAERIDVVDVTSDLGRSMLTAWIDRLIETTHDAQTGPADVIVLANGDLDASSRVRLDVVARSSTVVAKPVDADELVRTLDRVTEHERLQPMRILVIDDDPLVVRFLSETLRADKYALLYARGGDEGLRMIERHPCDAILLDLRMPDAAGDDVIRQLKLRRSPSPVPIIVMTNYPEPTNTEERQLLPAEIVLEVLSKTSVARDPRALIDQLDAVRSRKWRG